MQFITTCNLKAGDELLLAYGAEYTMGMHAKPWYDQGEPIDVDALEPPTKVKREREPEPDDDDDDDDEQREGSPTHYEVCTMVAARLARFVNVGQCHGPCARILPVDSAHFANDGKRHRNGKHYYDAHCRECQKVVK